MNIKTCADCIHCQMCRWIDDMVKNSACDFFKDWKGLEKQPHGECKTCKYYSPYRDQFSYKNRGDGYCKSAITTSEGTAYINCHDEWYCANYEREGEKR